MKKDIEQILADNEFWSPNMNASTLTEAIMKLIEDCVPKDKYPGKARQTGSDMHLVLKETYNAGYNVCRQAMIDNLGVGE